MCTFAKIPALARDDKLWVAHRLPLKRVSGSFMFCTSLWRDTYQHTHPKKRVYTCRILTHAPSVRVRVQCRQIQFQMQIPRVGTKNVLCLSVQVRLVVAGSLSQTICRNDFLIPIGADFRNLNLLALYAYP